MIFQNRLIKWTIESFCKLAKEKTKGACPMVAGGPDVGNWDPYNSVSQSEENEAIVNSVKACMDACDGYFLFDMIHLKMANQWQYVKEGIRWSIIVYNYIIKIIAFKLSSFINLPHSCYIKKQIFESFFLHS